MKFPRPSPAAAGVADEYHLFFSFIDFPKVFYVFYILIRIINPDHREAFVVILPEEKRHELEGYTVQAVNLREI